jgi:hypothetical protein
VVSIIRDENISDQLKKCIGVHQEVSYYLKILDQPKPATELL